MIGIYSITNNLNGKRYIGKSKNIKARFWQHKNALDKICNGDSRYKKNTNRHLANSVLKYGIENFTFKVLQEFQECSDADLADAEIYWMDFYKTTDRDFGYNLVRDSSSSVEVHEETKKILSDLFSGEDNPNFGNKWTDEQKSNMSNIKKAQFKDGTYDFMKTEEWKSKLSEWGKETWKDEEKKKAMARKVAEATSNLRFEQYDKHTMQLVGEYSSMLEIIDKYPDFHKIAIYSVCNGWKKSYRGFVWRSFEKV